MALSAAFLQRLVISSGQTFSSERTIDDYSGLRTVVAETVAAGQTQKEIYVGAGVVSRIRGLYIEFDEECTIYFDEDSNGISVAADDAIMASGTFAGELLENIGNGLTNFNKLKVTTEADKPVAVTIVVITDPTS